MFLLDTNKRDNAAAPQRPNRTPDGWRKVTLGEFAPFSYGKSLPVRQRNSSGRVPVVGSGGIIGYHDSAMTEGPTIVIGRKGTVGSVHYMHGPCWPIDTTFYVTGGDDALVRFKYYALKALGLEQMNSDSAVPGLNRNAAHARELLVPDESEQRAIAHILGALDDKIELNRRMNETLEEMARALFKSWFVDFDPVRAKLDGRWRRGQSLPGLPAEYYDLFPDRLVPSELGEIPAGWDIRPLDEIATFRNGLALQRYRPSEGEERLPVVKIAQLRAGRPSSNEWASANITSQCIIYDGDIVFSWSGSLIVDTWCGGRAALNQHLFKVTSLEYPAWYALRCIESHLADFRGIAADKSTTMGHIKREHLSQALCAVPDRGVLDIANRLLGPLLDSIVAAKVESRALAAQRDALLPGLVSGEVGV